MTLGDVVERERKRRRKYEYHHGDASKFRVKGFDNVTDTIVAASRWGGAQQTPDLVAAAIDEECRLMEERARASREFHASLERDEEALLLSVGDDGW